MVSDRKLALRILRRSPAFALVVVLLLALGISLNNSDKSSPESRHTS